MLVILKGYLVRILKLLVDIQFTLDEEHQVSREKPLISTRNKSSH